MGHFPIYRIAIMGDKEVGKQAFLYRFVFGRNDDTWGSCPTGGEHFDNSAIRLNGERSNGETCYITTHEVELPLERYSYIDFRETKGALIVYSIKSRASFEHATEYAAWIRGLDLVNNNGETRSETIPICLIGIDSGSSNTREVEYAEGEQLVIKLRLQGEFMEVSTRTGENVNKAFCDLLRQIRLLSYLAYLLKVTTPDKEGDYNEGIKGMVFRKLKKIFKRKRRVTSKNV